MFSTYLDHIVVAAPTLDLGVGWVRARLGVEARPGGVHARMGTHNRLLRLGDGCYLEIIAPDPSAPAPARPRWFGLDAMPADSAPRLLTWVARTDDIEAAVAACDGNAGEILPMSRGALNWRITVPPDGGLRLGGVAPTLIQWDTSAHPAELLPDDGLRLEGLTLFHPEPESVQALLRTLRVQGPVQCSAAAKGSAPHLKAAVRTPEGVRVLV